jgi:membrane-associated phospholipid phosphatase
MAHHSDFPHDPYAAEAIDSRGYALGRLVSQIFHPILINILAFLIVGYGSMNTHTAGLEWAGICILLLVLPPTIFYSIRLRQGAYSDEDVSRREQRTELYVFGLCWVLLAAPLLWYLGAPPPFLALVVGALGLGIVNGAINLFWKISAHAAVVASTATIALLYSESLGSQSLGIVLWVCALVVGWARVRTRNHTPMQVLAGFCTATVVVLAVFDLFGTAG